MATAAGQIYPSQQKKGIFRRLEQCCLNSLSVQKKRRANAPRLLAYSQVLLVDFGLTIAIGSPSSKATQANTQLMNGNMLLIVLTTIAAVAAIISCISAVFSVYFAREANRTTGFLEISATYGVVDVYDPSQVPEENVVIPGELFNVKPPIIRQNHGLHMDIRNTGRYQEQILRIGFTLNTNEQFEFQSVDPHGLMSIPIEIKQRLPFTVQPGEANRFFWVFNGDEYEQFERMTDVWFETARETVSVKIRN